MFDDDQTTWGRFVMRRPKDITRILDLLDHMATRYGWDDIDNGLPNLRPAMVDQGFRYKPLPFEGRILGVTYSDFATRTIIISIRNKARMSPDLHLYTQAHEFVHGMLHKLAFSAIVPGNPRFCYEDVFSATADDWHEYVAHQGAARLLVPPTALWQAREEGWTRVEMARRLCIPQELIDVRRQQI